MNKDKEFYLGKAREAAEILRKYKVDVQEYEKRGGISFTIMIPEQADVNDMFLRPSDLKRVLIDLDDGQVSRNVVKNMTVDTFSDITPYQFYGFLANWEIMCPGVNEEISASIQDLSKRL